jgi:pimeloyl-ACP methyl ester carboxylesterase
VLRVFTMMLAAPRCPGAPRPDYASARQALTVPALVIAGDHDAHAPPGRRRAADEGVARRRARCVRPVRAHAQPSVSPSAFSHPAREFARRRAASA